MTEEFNLQALWNARRSIEMPITPRMRAALMINISKKPGGWYAFSGNIADSIKFHEMWALRIGPDDEWLVQLYNRNFPFPVEPR